MHILLKHKRVITLENSLHYQGIIIPHLPSNKTFKPQNGSHVLPIAQREEDTSHDLPHRAPASELFTSVTLPPPTLHVLVAVATCGVICSGLLQRSIHNPLPELLPVCSLLIHSI